MKKLMLIAVLTAITQSCFTGRDKAEPLTEYHPVLVERSELEKSIKLEGPKPVKQPGKIYIYNHFLFLNDLFSGVHIYNNSDPENPEKVAFINIPGNVDIAISNDIIYADNSVDLVSLYYNGENVEVLDRKTNIFPEPFPPDYGAIPGEYLPENRPDNTIIIKWIEK